jgi:double-stranded uracil-DNA glycosylase
VATASAERGHYYSGRGNKFWQLLHESGFTPTRLVPEDDASLLSYGIGMTDLVKSVAQSHDRGLEYGGANAIAGHLISAAPQWVAFNGLTAGRAAAKQLGLGRAQEVALGEQSWAIGPSQVFVVPNSSGAHAAMPYADKLRWWTQFSESIR